MQMARGAEPGEVNLAVGEPFVLQDELLGGRPEVRFEWPQLYPNIGGEALLIEELKRSFPYKHIVITNGAKQGIEAAFFALKTVERRVIVRHHPPYWPSYRTLALRQGLEFNGSGPQSAMIDCITAPNNPCGRQDFPVSRLFDIWDGVYAQPLYGFHGVKPHHRIGIFSAAKYLGHSGIRVGWLGTDDEELARAASYFVEISTSGVAVTSQEILFQMLVGLRDPEYIAFHTEATMAARAALMANGESFREFMSDLAAEIHGVPSHGQGMFAWFRARHPEAMTRAFRDAKVKVVSGDACGMEEPGFFRVSMGHRPEVTREALRKVRDEYFSGWVGK